MQKQEIILKKCILCEKEHTEFCICDSNTSTEEQCDYCLCCWEYLYPNF